MKQQATDHCRDYSQSCNNCLDNNFRTVSSLAGIKSHRCAYYIDAGECHSIGGRYEQSHLGASKIENTIVKCENYFPTEEAIRKEECTIEKQTPSATTADSICVKWALDHATMCYTAVVSSLALSGVISTCAAKEFMKSLDPEEQRLSFIVSDSHIYIYINLVFPDFFIVIYLQKHIM